MEDDLHLLQSLIDAYGPCGQEEEIRSLCRKELEPLSHETWIDEAGNLIAKITGKKPDLPPVRIFVHMDEIAMIVKSIQEDGSLRINPLGAIYPASLGQGPLEILGDKKFLLGILSYGSIHTTKETPSTHKILPKEYKGEGCAPFWEDVRVTTRQTKSDLASAGVHPGTRVVIPKSRRTLCLLQDCFAGYYLDNRGALAIAIKTAKKLQKKPPVRTVYIAATAQEELGAHGASYAARTLPEGITIAIDVGPVSNEYQTTLSPNPIVVYQDGVATYNKSLADQLIHCGRKIGIHPQQAVFASYGSDASYPQSRGQTGTTSLICFPVENTHGYEITHKNSLQLCSDLLTEYLISSG